MGTSMRRRDFLAASSATLLALTARPEPPGMQAGVARVDLTPPLSMKACLGGYSERMSKPATGVHDRVWAKCVTLSQGEKRIALVTADALGFPPPVRVAVMERL